MATITKNITTDFPSGFSATQLDQEIRASSIQTNLTGVLVSGDEVSIIFPQPLSSQEVATLNSIVTAHVPIQSATIRPRLIVDNGILKAKYSDQELKYYGNRADVIKIDKTGQGDYTSLQAAVTANPYPGLTFIVYPGLYIENNPINLPPQTIVKSASGDASNTVFACYKPWLPIIKMYAQSALHSITISNAFMQGGIGVEFNGGGPPAIFSRIQGCLIIDCWTGVKITTPPNSLYLFETGVLAVYKPINIGIYVEKAVFGGGVSLLVTGNAYNKIPKGVVSTGDNSIFLFGSGIIAHCKDCIVLEKGGDVNATFVSIENSIRGAYIDNDGYPVTTLKLDNCTIRGMSGPHLEFTGEEGEFYFSNCKLQQELVINPKGASISSTLFSSEDSKFYQAFMGDVRIGSIYHPSALAIGEGKASTIGNAVLLNDNKEVGVWQDITTQASLNDSICFDMFGSNKKNNCIYIGNDFKFYGFKIDLGENAITDADSDNIQWEFWNGTLWQPLKIMVIASKPAYNSRANKFATEIENQFVYLSLKVDSPMAKKTLFNINKYWVRARLLQDISIIPRPDKIQVFYSYHSTQKDGYVQNFGSANCVKTMSWKLVSTAIAPPDDEAIYLSHNLCLKGESNLYPPNQSRMKSMIDCIPANINTAFPLKVSWRFTPRGDISGNVLWKLHYGKMNTSSYVYNNIDTAPRVHHTERTSDILISLTPQDKNKVIEVDLDLDVNDFHVRPDDGNYDMLWLTLERAGDDAQDTYEAHVAFIKICEVKYIEWCHGNHLLTF